MAQVDRLKNVMNLSNHKEYDLPQTDDEMIVDVIDIFINCFFINIVAPIGVIGNIISIIVLYRHNITHDCSNIILISLAVSDLLNLVTIVVRFSKCLVRHTTDKATALTVEGFVTAYVLGPSRISLFTSACLVTLMSIQRFVAVFFPFKSRQLFTPYRTKIASVSIYILAFTSTFVFCLFLTHEWVFDEALNKTVAVAVYTPFFKENYTVLAIYARFFLNIFAGGINLLITFSLSVSIALKMTFTSKKRQRLTQRDAPVSDPKVVKMLLIICLVCFSVFAPTTINDVYVYFIPNVSNSPYFIASKTISEALYVVHSSSNFVIYVTLSRKFSAALKLMFKCSSDKRETKKSMTIPMS